MRGTNITFAQAKSVLNRCPLDFADWTLNPYSGCAFGCSYCYVPPLKAKLGVKLPAPWGSFVEVKQNAAEVLRKQMRRIGPDERIAIGTATDPYQPVEQQFRITRSLLEQLCFCDNPVSLVTRSPLILRDMDILRKMPNLRISMSIPTSDDTVRRAFEPNATAIPGRLEAVRRLKEQGISVGIMWAPILPGVTDTARGIRESLQAFAPLGVRVFAGAMRDLNYFRDSFNAARRELLDTKGPDPTTLRGGEIGRAMEAVAKEYGVDLRISPSLYRDAAPLQVVPGRQAARNLRAA